jgi:hypothetical protein
MSFAAAPLLVEEAVGTTAAELTAEQIAAQAAEQAAQQAIAQQAAEQAAQQAAQAAEQAAQQTAQQVVQQAPPSGIETLAKEVKAGLDVSQLSNVQPEGIQQIVNAGKYPLPSAVPTVPSVPNIVPPGAEHIPPSNFGPASVAPPAAPPAPPAAPAAPVMEAPAAAQPTVDTSNLRFTDAMQGPGTNSSPFGPTQSAMYDQGTSLYNTQGIATGNPSPPQTYGDATYGAGQSRVTTNPADLLNQPTQFSEATSGIKDLFNQGLDYAKKNPLSTALGANALVNYLNKPKPYEKPKYKSTFNAGAYSGYEPATPNYYRAQYAHGGLADLGGYSDGGRMLKGPGDGMSDNIPATIANKQPARLANEEFVIPADVVSHLGNGSSEAGAKQLYKMMDRVRQARTGNKKQGKQINPEKYLA